jgi:hypothetical protein
MDVVITDQHELDWAIKAPLLFHRLGSAHYAAVVRVHFSMAVHWFQKQGLIGRLNFLNSTIIGFKYTFRFVNSHPQQPQGANS